MFEHLKSNVMCILSLAILPNFDFTASTLRLESESKSQAPVILLINTHEPVIGGAKALDSTVVGVCA